MRPDARQVFAVLQDVLQQELAALAGPPLLATPLRELPGWDSFRSVETVLACEARFAIRIPAMELDGIQTFGDLIAVCIRLHGMDRGAAIAGPTSGPLP